MKIKEIKCPSCNANVKLKDKATKGICEYCNTEFVIEDNTIKIEHTGTIEITNDTSLKVAETILNSFKDYDKSLLAYKTLLLKYAHKKEVYIGLIRSITKDFQLKILTGYQLSEINNYWEKYTSLAKPKEIDEYSEKINELNKSYWYDKLITITNNFEIESTKEKPDTIEAYYNNYIKYCNKKDKITLDNSYKQFITNYKKITDEKNKRKKKIKTIIIAIIIITLILIICFLLSEKSKKIDKKIKLTEINQNIENPAYFDKYLKNTFSEQKIIKISINTKDKTLDVTVKLKNIIKTQETILKYEIIDDAGPVITPISCEFKDTETPDLEKCFTIYDFSEGDIETKNAEINTDEIDFTVAGEKQIKVTIKDKNNNITNATVPVIITKTPITLQLNVLETLIYNNTYDISVTINPENIKDKSVRYTYDKNIIEIQNGKIKPLKKGTTEICAISNYNDTKHCKTVNVELPCQNKYTFYFDGSKEETITSNETFCPGTYKIYASVLNKDKFYHLDIKPKNEFFGDTLTIFKNSSHLNEEGSTYVLTDGYQIITEIGITSITLVKQ